MVVLIVWAAALTHRTPSTMFPNKSLKFRANIDRDTRPDYAPPRRPRWIIFTNIVRGHHRRQPSTSTNSITSPPSPLMVNVKRRQDLLLLLATPRNYKQKIRV
jgi:hypothetical protein